MEYKSFEQQREEAIEEMRLRELPKTFDSVGLVGYILSGRSITARPGCTVTRPPQIIRAGVEPQREQSLERVGLTCRLTLKPANVSVELDEATHILDALLKQGIAYPFGCKHGICGACKAKVTHGEVSCSPASAFALLDEERDEGYILLCCTTVASDEVVIEGPL